VIGAFAELERASILERGVKGIAAAKERASTSEHTTLPTERSLAA
jgi:DNA invertase Pin-like site-specific DNA recombinase